MTSHWLIIFNIRVSSCACELQTDLIFLWIKVSSVIQILSVAHIKGEMSKLLVQVVPPNNATPTKTILWCTEIVENYLIVPPRETKPFIRYLPSKATYQSRFQIYRNILLNCPPEERPNLSFHNRPLFHCSRSGIMSLLWHSILRHLLLRQSLLRLLILWQWPIVFAILALLAIQLQYGTALLTWKGHGFYPRVGMQCCCF